MTVAALSVYFAGPRANATTPVIEQVKPGAKPAGQPEAKRNSGEGTAALPVLREFLANDRGRITAIYTEVDVAARGRHILNLSLRLSGRYRCYVYDPKEAWRAFEVIVDYLWKCGYHDHVAFF